MALVTVVTPAVATVAVAVFVTVKRASTKESFDRHKLYHTRCLRLSLPLQARQLLFYPSDEDMALYPLLLAHPPPGADQEHPQVRLAGYIT